MNINWKRKRLYRFFLFLGGDILLKNIWFTEVMVDIFIENRLV